MKIYKAKDYDELSRKAASIIASQVLMKPDCVLGLATGSTPIGTYKQLIEWYNKGDLDFSGVKSVNQMCIRDSSTAGTKRMLHLLENSFMRKMKACPVNYILPMTCLLYTSIASVLMSSTETVLYCLSVYFGSVGITRTRYTLAGGLIATAAGVAASVVLAGAVR